MPVHPAVRLTPEAYRAVVQIAAETRQTQAAVVAQAVSAYRLKLALKAFNDSCRAGDADPDNAISAAREGGPEAHEAAEGRRKGG